MFMEHHCLENNPNPDPSAYAPPSSSSPSKLGDRKRSPSARNVKTRGGGRSGPLRLSTDPQSVAARRRRHRISDRFKILQSLVPGGSKMDTVSMLEEAIHYVKFLKAQIWLHHAVFEGRAGWSDLVPACSAAPPPTAHQWAQMAQSQQPDSASSSFVDVDHHATPPLSNLADLWWFQGGEETVSCDDPGMRQSLA